VQLSVKKQQVQKIKTTESDSATGALQLPQSPRVAAAAASDRALMAHLDHARHDSPIADPAFENTPVPWRVKDFGAVSGTSPHARIAV
jgi:hypothetical protein